LKVIKAIIIICWKLRAQVSAGRLDAVILKENQKQRFYKPLFMAHNLLSGEHCNEFPPPHNALLDCLFSAFFWSFAHVPFEYELY